MKCRSKAVWRRRKRRVTGKLVGGKRKICRRKVGRRKRKKRVRGKWRRKKRKRSVGGKWVGGEGREGSEESG